jgi:hypothetical protein
MRILLSFHARPKRRLRCASGKRDRVRRETAKGEAEVKEKKKEKRKVSLKKGKTYIPPFLPFVVVWEGRC